MVICELISSCLALIPVGIMIFLSFTKDNQIQEDKKHLLTEENGEEIKKTFLENILLFISFLVVKAVFAITFAIASQFILEYWGKEKNDPIFQK
jgi:hypothetical protein